MTNDDFKQMLDEALKPIKDGQAELRSLIETRVLPPLVYIETVVKGYAEPIWNRLNERCLRAGLR